jgi:ABC-2 type transport system permease protein
MSADLPAAGEILWRSARTQWAETRASPVTIVLGVVQPLVFTLVSLLPRAGVSAATGTDVAVGVLLTSFWGTTVWSAAGVLRRERLQGTLVRTVTGVRDPRLVVAGKALSAGVLSLLASLATVVVTFAVLRQPVDHRHPLLVVTGMLVVVASGGGAGMLIGALFVLTRHGPQLSSALTYPVYLLGGMLIPTASLPPGVRWASSVISLRWCAEFLVTSARGTPNLTALTVAVALTICYALLGVVVFRRVVDRARHGGSIELD